MLEVPTYHPKGKFLWDLWFIKEGDIYHSFYLQCDPIGRAEKRHDKNVSVGHAISQDLH